MAHVKAAVMGATDGIVTSFAIVAGASFVENAKTIVMVVGIRQRVAFLKL